jgi:hypothetical protein
MLDGPGPVVAALERATGEALARAPAAERAMDPEAMARIVAAGAHATGVEAWYNGLRGRQGLSDNRPHPRAAVGLAALPEAETKFPSAPGEAEAEAKREAVQMRRARVLARLNEELERRQRVRDRSG